LHTTVYSFCTCELLQQAPLAHWTTPVVVVAPVVVASVVVVITSAVVAGVVVVAATVVAPSAVVAVVVVTASQLRPLSMLPPGPSYAWEQSGHFHPALQ
jgi:hypothetical protein